MGRHSKEHLAPKTGAERARRYREKQRERLRSDPEAMEVERQRIREAKRRQRAKLTVEQRAIHALKMRVHRKKLSLEERELAAPASPGFARIDLHGPYDAEKGLQKVIAEFPTDEKQRKHVWQQIGLEFGYLKPSDICRDRKQLIIRETGDNLVNNADTILRDFFTRMDISQTNPGMNMLDFITVEDNTGKKVKVKKHTLTVCLKEAFEIFVEENQDMTIDFASFCEFRPQHVLPLEENPLGQ